MKTHSECLVLIVDSDREWCSRISGGLMVLEYKTAITFNSHQAIEMIEQLRPHVVVCDIDLSEGSATAVLDFGSRQARPVPVIVSASRSSYESPDIARALKRGAFDCLIKPYTPEILSRKIEQAIRVTSPLSVHDLLHDFSSFFNQMSRLNSSQDLEKLIDISFVYFLKISEAQSAALYFYNKDQRSWRKMRENISDGSSPPDDLPSAFINRVAAARRAFIDADIGSANDSGPPDNGTFLVIPLFAGNDLRGIVTLRRSSSQTPFSSANVHAAEIVAAQVGNALVNATLYETVNQKLLELQIISSYSEKLMGMVDKYDVIHCLAETTIRHFEMDFIGFLVIQRRIHEFLYWSRYSVDDKTLQEFGVETMTAYNRAAETNLRRRRFVTAAIKLDGYPNDPLRLPPLGFRSVLPLCWEDLRFGAVFIGSVDEPERASGKLALLSSIVGQTRIALTNTKLYGDMKENYIRTIKALAIAVDAKDTYTHGHSENVMNIAEEIARELSIEEKSIGSIRDAGYREDRHSRVHSQQTGTSDL